MEDNLLNIPALCPNCGNIFRSRWSVKGDDIINHINIKIDGVSSPCPKCGTEGEMRQDLIKFVQQSVNEMKGLSLDKISSVQEILKNALNPNVTINNYYQVQKDVELKSPEIKSFKDLMPKTRLEAYAFIALFLTVIGYFIKSLSNGEDVDTKKIFEKSIPKEKVSIINKLIKPKKHKNTVSIKSLPKRTPSLNQPCPCGSGKLFKRCHGLNI